MHGWTTIQSCDKWKAFRDSLNNQAVTGNRECIDLEDELMPSAGSERPMRTKKAMVAKKVTSSFSIQESLVKFIKEVSSSSTRNELGHQENNDIWDVPFGARPKV